MAFSQIQILTLIYRTEYYIINKDYEFLLMEEYGELFTNMKEYKKTLYIRMLLKALKTQYNLDYTSDYCTSLYIKINEEIELDIEILPDINTSLVVYNASNVSSYVFGSVILATYQELLGNLSEDYDKVVSVKVFNEYFSHLAFSTKIYKAVVNIADGLVITHNLSADFIAVSFYDTNGPIFCDYTITSTNSITINSSVTIPDVRVVILA